MGNRIPVQLKPVSLTPPGNSTFATNAKANAAPPNENQTASSDFTLALPPQGLTPYSPQLTQRYQTYLAKVAAYRQALIPHLPLWDQVEIETQQDFSFLQLKKILHHADMMLSPNRHQSLEKVFNVLSTNTLPHQPEFGWKAGVDQALQGIGASKLQWNTTESTISAQVLEDRLDHLESILTNTPLDSLIQELQSRALEKVEKSFGYQVRQKVTEASQRLAQTASLLQSLEATQESPSAEHYAGILQALTSLVQEQSSRLQALSHDSLYQRDGSLLAAQHQAQDLLNFVQTLPSHPSDQTHQQVREILCGLASLQTEELKAHSVVNAIHSGLVGKDPIAGALRAVSAVSLKFGGPSIHREDYEAFLETQNIPPHAPINGLKNIIQRVLFWKVQQKSLSTPSVPDEAKSFSSQMASVLGLDTLLVGWGAQDFRAYHHPGQKILQLVQSVQESLGNQDRLVLRDTIEGARDWIIKAKLEVGQDRLLRARLPTGIYEQAMSTYTQALKLLDQGKDREAQALFLKTQQGLGSLATRAFENYQTDQMVEHYTLGIAITVASGFAGAGLAGAVFGTEVAFGSAAWFGHTAVMAGGFWGTQTALNAAFRGQTPHYFREEGWDFVKDLGFDLGSSYGMFLVLGAGLAAYRSLAHRWAFSPRAAASLRQIGIRDLSSHAGKSLLTRTALLYEKNLTGLARILYPGGKFAAEYVALTGWEAVHLNLDRLVHQGRGANQEEWKQFLSASSLFHRGLFLACLKVGNTLAHGTIKKLGQWRMDPQAKDFLKQREVFLKDFKDFLDWPPPKEGLVVQLEQFGQRAQRLLQQGQALLDAKKLPRNLRLQWNELSEDFRVLPTLRSNLPDMERPVPERSEHGALGTYSREWIGDVPVYTPIEFQGKTHAEPTKGTVIMVAGAGANHTCFAELPHQLRQEGFGVKVLTLPKNDVDIPNYDSSSLDVKWKAQSYANHVHRSINQAMNQVLADHPQGPVFLGGFSLGGAATLRTYSTLEPNQQQRVQGLILGAPALAFSGIENSNPFLKPIKRYFGLPALAVLKKPSAKVPVPVDPNIAAQVSRLPVNIWSTLYSAVLFADGARSVLPNYQNSPHQLPVLLFHGGKNDPTVSYRAAQMIQQTFGNQVQTHTSPEAGHWVFAWKGRQESFDQVLNFVQNTKKSPSLTLTTIPMPWLGTPPGGLSNGSNFFGKNGLGLGE